MTTNSFVDSCPSCGKDTCLNNVNTRPPTHNLECWACGFFSNAVEGYMTEDERLELKNYMEGLKP